MEAEIKGGRHFALQVKCPSFLTDRNTTYIVYSAQESRRNLRCRLKSVGKIRAYVRTDIKHMMSLGWKGLGLFYIKT